MECFPCKHSIVIDYTDLSIGHVTSGPQLFSEIEAHLIISIKNEIFFSENGILLLELAKELKDWINNHRKNFYYKSMDYEEEPILFFKEKDSTHWAIGSVWVEKMSSDIELFDLINGCENFIEKLTYDLKLNKINIRELL